MFKTFKATIHGGAVDEGVDAVIIFNKYRILLTPEQVGKIYFSFAGQRLIPNRIEYIFERIRNKIDEHRYAVRIMIANNPSDDWLYVLDIDRWNTIKAKIIHGRYWLYREREYLIKALVTAAIGFLFSIIGIIVGYRLGHQSGIKESQSSHQSTSLKP